MTDRLSLYNGALRACGERKLVSLTENREPRRLLDDVWDGGAVAYCLEQGLWNFAMRAAELTYAPSVTPSFGYRYAFNKPTDLVRLANISADEYFADPLTRYLDEAGYWLTDVDTIYVRYVSNDAAYGLDMSRWPETFCKLVEGYLAAEIAPRLTLSASKVEALEKAVRKLAVDARSKDAMGEATAFLPTSSWVRARGGRDHGDRGPRGNLIG